jgi:hypothetical protein
MVKRQQLRKSKQRGGSMHGGKPVIPEQLINATSDMSNSSPWLWIIGLVVIVILATIGYLIYQNQRTQDKLTDIIDNTKSQPAIVPEINTAGVSPQRARALQNGRLSLAHPELAGHRVVVADADNGPQLSYWDYLNMKDHERVINPLLPPERSYENTYGIPLNIPSRGFSGGFQQVGMLYKNEVSNDDKKPGNNTDSVIIPIFGQPLYPGANKWNYYVSSDKYNMVKMPFTYEGKKSDDQYGVNELVDGSVIQLPEYNGEFVAKIYQYDKPRYLPFIY